MALVALALIAGGCGGDEADDYAESVREIGQTLQDSDVGKQLQNVENPQQLAEALREAADLLDDAAADLEDLDAPGEVAEAHQKLTEGARETADTFRDVADRVEDGKAEDVLSLLGELTRGGGAKKLEEGLKELEAEGYDVREESNQ